MSVKESNIDVIIDKAKQLADGEVVKINIVEPGVDQSQVEEHMNEWWLLVCKVRAGAKVELDAFTWPSCDPETGYSDLNHALILKRSRDNLGEEEQIDEANFLRAQIDKERLANYVLNACQIFEKGRSSVAEVVEYLVGKIYELWVLKGSSAIDTDAFAVMVKKFQG